MYKLLFPYFGGQFKSWSSFRRVLSYSNCFSNSDLKWSINYDKVFYSMFKKRSTTGSEKYKRYLHEQLNLTPVVPERKLRGEQLSLPYQSCCEPREVEDPLNSRKDCVQTQHLPSNGTFAKSVPSNQNRQKKRCSAVVPISVERNGVVEPTVTALKKTSHSFVAANTVTYDSTRLDPDRHGR
ncbi:hypothetical protein DPMN_174725 [Dreissena polymorpha]|uniref:Uncharacterized protein n=1 Tax=Dreissena polymorpha TaxID=45954 RepID=A0A9D4E6U0_DREPO|nr:hypothetical protein DPMN_174725 [Dreissena polymorpha]